MWQVTLDNPQGKENLKTITFASRWFRPAGRCLAIQFPVGVEVASGKDWG